MSKSTAAKPAPEIRTVDSKSRLLLPKQFANSTVTFEMLSDTEVVIRKAAVIPEADMPAIEDTLQPLSNEDRDFLLNLLDNPPEPNDVLRRAAARSKERYG
jgi:uncharacterized protein (DUF1778 family)